ncbi:sodium:proton antiporter [Bacillus velezensis]|uniref:Na+/H+ antiporter NhaC family protein n=1 Tax=Bacillus amyloliquefaciens group TaxID=1938374 RepID=UPI000AA0EF1F|nr:MULTISPECIES: Na+/H+ antiporter NhaC family protein [Bacillus amyloliquefaciens group]MDK4205364.1 Na+/H+ antiporter NhaC family protein [Bacillus velezensis]NMV99067.1 sodium:proton antiporter [Bacillus velezensis]TNU35489.1 sodium:proton antiporter [Bacillus velezensis]TNU62745.1 sodium:proton antiporter [Bacillus velezensis]USP43362.1 sodium:proton antiporter [Bacillus amyloliquefaciens]
MAAVIAVFALFMFQRFHAGELVTHFIKGGNELVNVIIMLSLIWAVTAVAENLGFSKYVTSHLTSWSPHMFIAPSLFILGVVISYFIGSSWGTWGARRNAGGSVTYQLIISERNIWFASPLSDNTVLGIDVVKCTRSKLVPAINAAGISVVLYGAYFSDNKYFLKALSEIGITPF